MDNVCIHIENYFLRIGVTTFHEKLISLNIDSLSKLVEFNELDQFN